MTQTQTIEAIHAHLDSNPTDWQARRELADLYEDAGQHDEARLQRWMVEHGIAPVRTGVARLHPWYWKRNYGEGKPSVTQIGGAVMEYGNWPSRESAERYLCWHLAHPDDVI